MANKYEPDSKPLTEAVMEIFRIADRNKRGSENTLEQLNEIIDAAERGKLAYRDNVMTAQKAELADLRKATSA